MTDEQLLRAAAKAAGIEAGGWNHEREALFCDAAYFWNPLRSDGDALRLAVKLKIDLRFPDDNDMYVDAGSCDAYTVYLIDTGDDRAAAVRRAIVRAAAALPDDRWLTDDQELGAENFGAEWK